MIMSKAFTSCNSLGLELLCMIFEKVPCSGLLSRLRLVKSRLTTAAITPIVHCALLLNDGTIQIFRPTNSTSPSARACI